MLLSECKFYIRERSESTGDISSSSLPVDSNSAVIYGNGTLTDAQNEILFCSVFFNTISRKPNNVFLNLFYGNRYV